MRCELRAARRRRLFTRIPRSYGDVPWTRGIELIEKHGVQMHAPEIGGVLVPQLRRHQRTPVAAARGEAPVSEHVRHQAVP